MCGPIGVLLGYIVAAFCIAHESWRWAFYFQAGVMMVVVIMMLIVPRKYMDLGKTSDATKDKINT